MRRPESFVITSLGEVADPSPAEAADVLKSGGYVRGGQLSCPRRERGYDLEALMDGSDSKARGSPARSGNGAEWIGFRLPRREGYKGLYHKDEVTNMVQAHGSNGVELKRRK
ncbi:hypothetical protein C8R44DRAFT_739164 [Mycena epipterygia]|nr:hypothetical protein C8R44DRAFT_739164 [Mycena epipterygia]